MTWRERLIDASVRSGTFVAAAVVILLAFRTAGLHGDSWAITSVALVMQDSAKASTRTAAIRVVVNIVSAFVALAALWLGGSSILSYAVALLVVGMLCYLAGLADGIRSAYICVIIVIGADPSGAIPPAIERIGAVAAGSVIGVLVSQILAKWAQRSAVTLDPDDSTSGRPAQPG